MKDVMIWTDMTINCTERLFERKTVNIIKILKKIKLAVWHLTLLNSH